jgi:phenylpyruvate tautomerase PptA (4-oxalocrotonate tautomerase family)
MPYIEVKTNAPMTEQTSSRVKSKLGEAISIVAGKSENWLMTSFTGWVDMSFGGTNKRCAMVEVAMYGGGRREECNALCAKVTEVISNELGISPDRIYVKFEMAENWGWNGGLF